MPLRHLLSKSFRRVILDRCVLPARMDSQKYGRGLLTRIIREQEQSTHNQFAGAISMQACHAIPKRFRASACRLEQKGGNRNTQALSPSRLSPRNRLASEPRADGNHRSPDTLATVKADNPLAF